MAYLDLQLIEVPPGRVSWQSCESSAAAVRGGAELRRSLRNALNRLTDLSRHCCRAGTAAPGSRPRKEAGEAIVGVGQALIRQRRDRREKPYGR